MTDTKPVATKKKKFLDKKIPTLIGIGVLVVALVAGTLLLGKGGGVFAPRASADATPKQVKITNVYDNSFTVSFLTDGKVAGFIKYGEDNGSIKSQAGDDRDQITGTVGEFTIHHITVRGLKPSTTYYYKLGTGSGNTFDNSGQPFTVKTTARNGAPSAAKTIYGSVTNQAGAPAEGSIVYIAVNGAGTMSSQVKASGSWAIPLSNARTTDGSNYAEITDTDSLLITIQGPLATQKASITTTVASAQPVETISFGQTSAKEIPKEAVEKKTIKPVIAENNIKDIAKETVKTATNTAEQSNNRESLLNDLATAETTTATDSSEATQSAEVLEINLEDDTKQTVTTTQPKIIGKAKANAVVTITVHSDTQIEQEITADEDGNFVLDIATLSKNLEPGEHTVTYSYTDSDTNEVVTKTVTFTVAEPTVQLADASTTTDNKSTPYGSGNPYTADSSPSAEASNSAQATQEARTAQPATGEGIPVSGTVSTTLAMVFGGLFFIIAGLWSFWISNQLEKQEQEV